MVYPLSVCRMTLDTRAKSMYTNQMRILTTTLLLALTLVGCLPKKSPTPVPQPQPSQNIEVLTSDAGSGAPIADVVVRVNGVERGLTNQDGYLLVGPVFTGELLTWDATKAGYGRLEGSFTPTPADISIRAALRSDAVEPPIPTPTPTPTPTPAVTRALRIHPDLRYFAYADTGEVADYRELSAFSLLGQTMFEGIDVADAWIQHVQAAGFNAGRVAATFTLYPGGMVDPARPGYWEAVHALTQRAASRGFYLRWTLWMASEPFGGVWYPDRRDIWQGDVRRRGEEFGYEFVRQVAGYNNVLIELANEPGEIGMRDSFAALVAFGSRIKQDFPHLLLNAGSPRDEGDQTFTRRPFDFLDSHLPRHYFQQESWPSTKRKTDHPQVDPHQQPVPMVFMEGEPTNYGSKPPGRNDYDASPASAFCAAAISRVTSSYLNFHFDGGIYGRMLTEADAASAAAFHRGLDAIPMFSSYSLYRGHWQESPARRAPFAPADDERTVVSHVNAGNLWRIVGTRGFFVGLMEHKNFDMARHADVPITPVSREVTGNYACGVYRR